MDKDRNWFDKFASVMDQNIRGVQYGVYFVAGLGFVIAIRSVRPFLKLKSPSDIPKHFMVKKMPFYAKVVSVQPSMVPGRNPLILVNHYPLLSLPIKNETHLLPLEVASVDVTSNGFIWLQSMLVGDDIKFIPLRTDADRVYSIIYKKKQNVGQHLISIGFGSVSGLDFKLEKDEYYMNYYKSLLSEEQRAERKGAGIWADTKKPASRLVYEKIKNLISFLLVRNFRWQ